MGQVGPHGSEPKKASSQAVSEWRRFLARLYPEVLEAHAQFGGDLGEMLFTYHYQVVTERESHSEGD